MKDTLIFSPISGRFRGAPSSDERQHVCLLRIGGGHLLGNRLRQEKEARSLGRCIRYADRPNTVDYSGDYIYSDSAVVL